MPVYEVTVSNDFDWFAVAVRAGSAEEAKAKVAPLAAKATKQALAEKNWLYGEGVANDAVEYHVGHTEESWCDEAELDGEIVHLKSGLNG